MLGASAVRRAEGVSIAACGAPARLGCVVRVILVILVVPAANQIHHLLQRERCRIGFRMEEDLQCRHLLEGDLVVDLKDEVESPLTILVPVVGLGVGGVREREAGCRRVHFARLGMLVLLRCSDSFLS